MLSTIAYHNAPYLALVVMSLLSAIGQIEIKLFSREFAPPAGFMGILRVITNKHFIRGTVCVLVAPLFYFYSLSRLQLLTAFSFNAVTFILVLLFSHILLKEKLQKNNLAAVLFISVGIIIFYQ